MKNLTKKSVKAAYRRMPRFIWKADEFNQLSEEGKLMVLFLLAHPDLTELGTLMASSIECASELGWSLTKWQTTLKDLAVQQEVYCDEKVDFLWLPRVLTYQLPQSPTQARRWWKALSHVPRCSLQQILCAEIHRLVQQMPENIQWYLLARLRGFETHQPPRILTSTSQGEAHGPLS